MDGFNLSNGSVHMKHGHGITVAMWNFEYVRDEFVVCMFVMTLILMKLIYEHIQVVAKRIPESCILIIIGVIFGAVMLLVHDTTIKYFLTFKQKSFFLFLLPPIVLESAYSLRDHTFVKLLGPILLFAVVGTILNIFLLAPLLYGIYSLGLMGAVDPQLEFMDCLLFGALIAAVDPVAVLAIFQEVGVHKALYFMVFGEALLNDAVTIVIYRLVLALQQEPSIGATQVFLGFAAFLATSLGAMIIGLIMGAFTALITRFTEKLTILEPIILYVMGYLAYLFAEMFEFSGIISMICCGFLQCQYASENIAPKSFLTVIYFAKAISNITESVIFLILGFMVIHSNCWGGWDTGFVVWSLVVMVSVRFVVIYTLTAILNFQSSSTKKINWQETFLMAYGGLRGAISFSLAFMIEGSIWAQKPLMLSATFVIIFFTVFFQGISIKPLVTLLKIEGDKSEINLFSELSNRFMYHMTEGIEVITGEYGHRFVMDFLHFINRVVVRKYLQKKQHVSGTHFLMSYQTLALRSALSKHGNIKDTNEGIAHPKYSNQELKLLDQSILPSTFAETFMDAQSYTEGPKRRKTIMNQESQKEMMKFSKILRSNLSKNPVVNYRQNDATLPDLQHSQTQTELLKLLRQISIKRKSGDSSKLAALAKSYNVRPGIIDELDQINEDEPFLSEENEKEIDEDVTKHSDTNVHFDC